MNTKSKQFNSTIPGRLNSIAVNGDLSFALRKFKKNQKDNNIIEDCYNRKFYVKPSVRKKLQKETAKYKQSKEQND